MKSMVFSFKSSVSRRGVRKNISLADIKYFLRRYGIHTAFLIILLVGLFAGAVYAGNAETELLNSLDFLFTTNLDVRLTQNAIGTFCACFASDFIFLSSVFLLGLAPWGIPVIPFLVLFKGFGTGLTAGWLIFAYSLKGAGFYLLVLLPGTFLFCIALITLSVFAFGFSKKIFLNIAAKSNRDGYLHREAVIYCSRSMTALIMTFFAAIIDAALWSLLSGAFNF